MSPTTIKTTDKIKLLEQMLEDLAGDEFDDYEPTESNMNASSKQYTQMEQLDIIDITH